MARFCLNLTCAQRENSDQTLVCQTCQQDLLVCDRYFLTERLSSPKANAEVWKLEDWGYWQNPALDLDDQDEFEATDKVIKIIKYNDFESVSLLRQEYQILRELNSRFQHLPIPTVSRDTAKSLLVIQGNYCLVMSYLPGISLSQWLTSDHNLLNSITVYDWLTKCSNILQTIHQAGICHLDLHPGNILIDSNENFSIIDFGSAMHYPGRCLRTGIASYAAPELNNGEFVPASDYFSLARTFLYLCTGKDPEILLNQHRKREWKKFAPQLSPQCILLLNDLMEVSILRRSQYIADLSERLYTRQYPVKVRVRQASHAASFSALATIMTVGIRLTGIMMGLELQAYDLGLRLRPHEPVDERIVIVLADPPPPPLSPSISNHDLKLLLKKLNADGATTIGLDLYRDFPVDSKDIDLIPLLQKKNLFGVCNIADPTVANDPGIAPPPDMNIDNIGYADAPYEGNQVIRRHLLAISSNPDNPCPAYLDLAFLMALHFLETAYGISVTETSTDANLQFNSVQLRELNSGQFRTLYLDRMVGAFQRTDLRGRQILINYRSRPHPNQITKKIYLSEALRDNIPPKLFKNRIVLIGAISSSTTEDIWGTPLAVNVPGVFIQAHKVSQLISHVLDQRPLLWVLPLWAEVIWIWSWSAALGFSSLLFRNFSGKILTLVAILLSSVCLSCYVLLLQASWFPLIPTVLSMVLTGIMINWRGRIPFPKFPLRP